MVGHSTARMILVLLTIAFFWQPGLSPLALQRDKESLQSRDLVIGGQLFWLGMGREEALETLRKARDHYDVREAGSEDFGDILIWEKRGELYHSIGAILHKAGKVIHLSRSPGYLEGAVTPEEYNLAKLLYRSLSEVAPKDKITLATVQTQFEENVWTGQQRRDLRIVYIDFPASERRISLILSETDDGQRSLSITESVGGAMTETIERMPGSRIPPQSKR